jgi:hypothetical protein
MKKLVAIVLITISVLSLSATAEDILFNAVIQMLNQTDDDAAFTVDCRYDEQSNTVFYIPELEQTTVEFIVANSSDKDILEYRKGMLEVAQGLQSIFEDTERPDVNISVGVYSSDGDLLLVATPTMAMYQGDLLSWNDRSADYNQE